MLERLHLLLLLLLTVLVLATKRGVLNDIIQLILYLVASFTLLHVASHCIVHFK